ncbi:hypothetical protein ABZ208_27350 [Streptomyces sp. NPDC006208]|uniref:hypothetical protein n=1 Tax=Streptomyces sp. NPDC006208 TaxID=3156734 RepID=UPI0033ADAF19
MTTADRSTTQAAWICSPGEKYVPGKDKAKKAMGFSKGCFYWNTRQYEGTFEVDGDDNFMGQIEY